MSRPVDLNMLDGDDFALLGELVRKELQAGATGERAERLKRLSREIDLSVLALALSEDPFKPQPRATCPECGAPWGAIGGERVICVKGHRFRCLGLIGENPIPDTRQPPN